MANAEMILEAKFEKKIRAWLDSLPHSWHYKPEPGGRRAIPDIIACINGRFVALEVKISEAESRKKTGRIVLQRHNINLILDAGGIASIVYPENFELVKEYILQSLT